MSGGDWAFAGRIEYVSWQDRLKQQMHRVGGVVAASSELSVHTKAKPAFGEEPSGCLDGDHLACGSLG